MCPLNWAHSRLARLSKFSPPRRYPNLMGGVSGKLHGEHDATDFDAFL